MLRVEKVRGGKTVLKFAGLANEAEPTESLLCSCDEMRMYCTERRNLGRQAEGHECLSPLGWSSVYLYFSHPHKSSEKEQSSYVRKFSTNIV